MSQGESRGFTEARWRLWKGSELSLEEGNKEACGPRALELDSQGVEVWLNTKRPEVCMGR